tara:strand:+ start:469 stop:1137 length:669 start_codon:yes stop_codon:yes gene_type:complete
MRWILALALTALPTATSAQIVSGHATVVDGDTLEMTGERIRLFGIDAPEVDQTCIRGGIAWNCGEESVSFLAQLIHKNPIECEQRDRDDHGRMVAQCRANGIDLAGRMIDAGMAIALSPSSSLYGEREARAFEYRYGLWSSQFEVPADYRAARSQRKEGEAPAGSLRKKQIISPPSQSAVYYRNCVQARTAGAAPLIRGQSGYREALDRDNDGIACEPYRRK